MRATIRSAVRTDLLGAQAKISARNCDKTVRRANQFGFSETVSSPQIKNIPLSFSPKSAA
jgi:hypothetical protein